MSSRIEIPHSKDEARKVLNLFNDNAHNLSNQDAFSHAIDYLYKGDFDIKKDPGGRMYFKCLNCKKEMNNLKSLSEHANSGSHLKNVDLNPKIPEQRYEKVVRSNYSRHSLQEKLTKTTIAIVGLERVEAFQCGGRKYYKCTTCGAHGSVDSMYRHLIGDKHTDRYINARIELKNRTITFDERNHFRKCLQSDVSSIKIIDDPKLYPYLWESEGKKHSSKKKAKLEEEDPSSMEVDQNADDEITLERTQSIGVQSNLRPTTEEDFKYLTDKFQFIIFSNSKETRLESPEDLQLAIIIMSFALHWLFYVNRNCLIDAKEQDQTEFFLKQQKSTLESCLGHVEISFQNLFKQKYPHLPLDIDDKAKREAT